MKRFCDLTMRERATLTEGQIALYEDYALMERGLTWPVAPQLEELPELPLLDATELYAIKADYMESHFLFSTSAAAMEVLDMICGVKDYYSGLGGNYNFCKSTGANAVVPVTVYAKEDIEEARPVLKARDTIKQRNAAKLKKYDDEQILCREIVEDIRSAILDARDTVAQQQRDCDKYSRFLEITEGDEAKAFDCLVEGIGRTPAEEARELYLQKENDND